MAKILLILVAALVVEAVGVVYLSKGIKQVKPGGPVSFGAIVRAAGRGLVNPSLLLGVALETAFFVALIYLLAQKDVSLIWPLTSLGFVLTAVSAQFILNEKVSALRWLGVIIIVIGAGLVSYSEKVKEKPSAAASQTPPGPE